MESSHQRIIDNLEKKDRQLAERQANRKARLAAHYVWMTLGAMIASAVLSMMLACIVGLGIMSILALTAAGAAAGAAVVLLNRGPAGGALVIAAICFPVVLLGMVYDSEPIVTFYQMIVVFTTLPGWPIAGVVLGLSHDAWDKANGTI